MTITWDYYFWLVLACILGGIAVTSLVVWIGIRWKPFGRIGGAILFVLGCSYNLVQCSNIIAHEIRPATPPADHQPPA